MVVWSRALAAAPPVTLTQGTGAPGHMVWLVLAIPALVVGVAVIATRRRE